MYVGHSPPSTNTCIALTYEYIKIYYLAFAFAKEVSGNKTLPSRCHKPRMGDGRIVGSLSRGVVDLPTSHDVNWFVKMVVSSN